MNELFAIKYDMLLTEFNRHNLERIAAHGRHDDHPNRPIAYVDVGKLAPIRSRLVAPHVLSHPPEALATA